MMAGLRSAWRGRIVAGWHWLRRATGDDAYERYLEHHTLKHPGQVPLSREAFYRESLNRKWSGVSRCC